MVGMSTSFEAQVNRRGKGSSDGGQFDKKTNTGPTVGLADDNITERALTDLRQANTELESHTATYLLANALDTALGDTSGAFKARAEAPQGLEHARVLTMASIATRVFGTHIRLDQNPDTGRFNINVADPKQPVPEAVAVSRARAALTSWDLTDAEHNHRRAEQDQAWAEIQHLENADLVDWIDIDGGSVTIGGVSAHDTDLRHIQNHLQRLVSSNIIRDGGTRQSINVYLGRERQSS